MLKFLLEKRGEIVGREVLLEEVWQDSFVEDSNLTVTISQLRKTLARYDDEMTFVETIPKRGYRFTSDVSEIFEEIETPLIVEKHTLERLTIEEENDSEIESPANEEPKLLPKTKGNRIYCRISFACFFGVNNGRNCVEIFFSK